MANVSDQRLVRCIAWFSLEDEMSDVLARLMRWMETSDIDDADVVLRDAITEIAGLRARLDERRRMPTLTDEEREAIDAAQTLAGLEAAATHNENNEREKEFWNDCKSTLRLLLERTK